MLVEPAAIARLLGLRDAPKASPFYLMASIENGLLVTSLDRVAHSIAPADAEFKYRLVAKATLARRKSTKNKRLTPAESYRLARIANIWLHAVAVWKSDGAARDFLLRPHMMLENRRPIDVALASEVGAELVDQILGRLAYGSAA
jgi:putative toxin-antitoxin system antitoxin component (TIGR02293 family)